MLISQFTSEENMILLKNIVLKNVTFFLKYINLQVYIYIYIYIHECNNIQKINNGRIFRNSTFFISQLNSDLRMNNHRRDE
jgi:hypothetical protein